MIKLKYINKIKRILQIHSQKKSTNLLEGNYQSINRGKSRDFDNLREYTMNDDWKDIDWKSSTRSKKLLIKQYTEEKRHSILLLLDSGVKMEADTNHHENKKDLATDIAGLIGYLAIQNKDEVGMLYQNEKQEYKPFKSNLYDLEKYLCEYASNKTKEIVDIEGLLLKAKKIPKKKIIFFITDIAGINAIKPKTLREINLSNDLRIICIEDHTLTGDSLFDVEEKIFIPKFFLEDKRLENIENMIKKKLWDTNKQKCRRLKIPITLIGSTEEIVDKIKQILEE